MRNLTAYLLCLLLPCSATADETFPAGSWVEKPSPYASPYAYPGGEISLFAHQYPKSLNYYLDTLVTTARIFSLLYETLLGQNADTLEFEPNLASRWTISDDKMSYTFTIDERARWSDGKPVTAQDVTWTFNAILDPKNLTGPHKVSLERFHPPEIIDGRTIRFTAKQVHWENLIALGTFHILPSHAFKDQDFNKINFSFPVVSGPYRVRDIQEGIHVTLAKRYDWWQIDFPRNEGLLNFDTIRNRYYANDDNGFEAFKSGTIDYYPVYASYRWATETAGEAYDKSWIVKQKVYNYNPVGFQGFAMNLRRGKFADKRVRIALAHLLDRKRMNETLMYNAYFLHQCYYFNLYDGEHECQAPLIEFDKAKARQLLGDAGWRVNRTTGLLEKDGKPFVIDFLTRDPSSDKFLAVYREDLKDVGIQLNIVRKDMSAWLRDLDEYNYDMTWAAWSAGLYVNPEFMWLSSEADRPAGQNITGYKDPEVDKLIMAQRTEFDVEKRHAIDRKIDTLVANDIPYILLWNLNYTRVLYWNKFGTPDTVLGRINDEVGAIYYWWYDENSAADLEFARKSGMPLPGKPAEVHFDQVTGD